MILPRGKKTVKTARCRLMRMTPPTNHPRWAVILPKRKKMTKTTRCRLRRKKTAKDLMDAEATLKKFDW